MIVSGDTIEGVLTKVLPVGIVIVVPLAVSRLLIFNVEVIVQSLLKYDHLRLHQMIVYIAPLSLWI